MSMSLGIDVLGDPSELTEAVVDGWWALAVRAGMPFATPAWMLAFWRHVHAAAGRLEIVVVRDGETVIGVGPFCGPAEPGRLGLAEHGLLASGIGQRTGPLAEPGAEHEVARAFAAALADRAPRPTSVALDAMDAASPFPAALAEAWPGRAAKARVEGRMPGLITTVGGDFDAWRAGRSRNYRRQQVRRRRDIEARGGVVRRSETAEWLDADLDALFRLHRLRFAVQGRATSLGEAYRAAVGEAARALHERDGGARLWVVEAGGEVVGAQLFLRCGDRVCAWNGGIDPAWKDASLGLVLYDEGIRDAHELGAAVLDWGSGDQEHKRHFANADEPLAWWRLLMRGARYPLVRAALAPRHAREAAKVAARRLPPGVRRRLAQLAR